MNTASSSTQTSRKKSTGARGSKWASKSQPVVACKSSPSPHISSSSHSFRGILGYGPIGRQCARLGQALGMDVFAYTLNPRPTSFSRVDITYHVPDTGDPDGLIPRRWFSGGSREDINNFLSKDLDLLIVSLPLNDATRGLIGKEQFDIMSKRKTFVSNIARGAIINTDALVEALNEGKIRGAALDVTEPEPLPKGHPLWKAPNVFITPHIAWMSNKYWENVTDLLLRNLDRIANGEQVLNPEMRRGLWEK